MASDTLSQDACEPPKHTRTEAAKLPLNQTNRMVRSEFERYGKFLNLRPASVLPRRDPPVSSPDSDLDFRGGDIPGRKTEWGSHVVPTWRLARVRRNAARKTQEGQE